MSQKFPYKHALENMGEDVVAFVRVEPNDSVTFDTRDLRCESCGELLSGDATLALRVDGNVRGWHVDHAPPPPPGLIPFEDLGPAEGQEETA